MKLAQQPVEYDLDDEALADLSEKRYSTENDRVFFRMMQNQLDNKESEIKIY